MATYTIDGFMFVRMIKYGAINLKNNAETVNDLNVFPIPDGDTGSNMARTIEGGAAKLNEKDETSFSDAANRLADGMLLSARGNSGVILSQFFEGFRKSVDGSKAADLATLCAAFKSGVRKAYSAVVKPTEGTMLTVMREATEYAVEKVGENGTIEGFFDAFIEEMYASLDRTPELLPILKESGVIDSGGAGFAYIIEGMNSALRGKALSGSAESAFEKASGEDTANFDENSAMSFGYCTELIVQLMSSKTDVEKYDAKTLIDYLERIGGESIVAFKNGTRLKLHVHTFEPDKVLEYCRSIGEFVTVKIENMSIQHTESRVQNRFSRQTPKKLERRKFGTVTVADGAGLRQTFSELGADCVIDGKQTMNPSTEDFIKAFDQTDADDIFVLPNNSNIILTAKQAAELYTASSIHIIDSKTIAEGYAAMTMLDYTSGSPSEIAENLQSAAKSVTTDYITTSVRDCTLGGISIKKGDWLGFSGKEILSASTDINEAIENLLEKTDMEDKSVIIAIRGKDAPEGAVETAKRYIEARDLEFYELDGGQDVYSVIFVIE